MSDFDISGLRESLGFAPPKAPSKTVSKSPSDFDADLKRTVTPADQAILLNKERNKLTSDLQNAGLSVTDRARLQKDLEALDREIALLPANVRNMQPAIVEPQSDFMLEGLRDAIVAPSTAVEKPVAASAAAPAPVVKKMFEPSPGSVGKKFEQAVESIPGVKEIGAFGNVAAGQVSKSIGAVQQLVGQYFPGLDESTRQAIMSNAERNIGLAEAAMAPAKKEFPKTAIAGEVAGYIASPVSKLIPGMGPSTSLVGAGAKGGVQGGLAGTLMEPVTDKEQPFFTEKAKQATTGALFGAGGGALFQGLSTAGGKTIDTIRQKFGGLVPDNQLNQQADEVLKAAGITANNVPKEYFKGLQDQAKLALQTGDVKGFQKFARNFSEADELGIPMLRGQLTRDPMQYAVEQNIAGIKGVGEPIQTVMAAQVRAMLQRLDDFGAAKGESITASGSTLKNSLRKSDEEQAQKVNEAYLAYRQSTGRNIDVPLQGIAQDYAKVLRNFGADQIPSGVRNNFEALGLMSGKQLKVTTIDDAEELIKIINRNYDPAKQAKGTINALDDLRKSVNKAIYDAGANLPGQAGAAAKAARKSAQDRFDIIDSIPALRDVTKGKEPDKFVQNHILQGNVNQISKMRDYLQTNNPEALAQVQNDIIKHIKNRVTGNISDENAKFSQAGLKEFLSGPMGDRLKNFLTPQQFNNLNKLNRVAENAFVEPVGARVNRSNTASAAANLVKSTVQTGEINNLLSSIAGLQWPLVTGAARYAQERIQGAKARGMLREALEPTQPRAPQTTIPLSQIVKPGVAGAGAGRGYVEQRNLEMENR